VLLKKGANPKSVAKQLTPETKNEGSQFINYHLKPLTDIHLRSAVRGEISPNSNARYLWFLSAIAIILLIIAGINFTSLATAQALQRYKEAGIRKVLGAGKRQLIGQFLMEAVLLAFIAIAAGYFIIYYALPSLNTIAGSQFVFVDFFNLSSILLFTGGAVTIGILAGIYPAIMLSAFRPVKTLKGLAPSGQKGSTIWKSIVVVQFAASIAMIICTVTIYQQLQYIQSKELGFDKERIIIIPNRFGEKTDPMKSRLSSIPGIENVSISSYVPGTSKTSGTGLVQVPGRPDSLTFNWVSVGYNYFDTYGIKLKEGRTFSK
jgi:putative ABC transport system permease protein